MDYIMQNDWTTFSFPLSNKTKAKFLVDLIGEAGLIAKVEVNGKYLSQARRTNQKVNLIQNILSKALSPELSRVICEDLISNSVNKDFNDLLESVYLFTEVYIKNHKQTALEFLGYADKYISHNAFPAVTSDTYESLAKMMNNFYCWYFHFSDKSQSRHNFINENFCDVSDKQWIMIHNLSLDDLVKYGCVDYRYKSAINLLGSLMCVATVQCAVVGKSITDTKAILRQFRRNLRQTMYYSPYKRICSILHLNKKFHRKPLIDYLSGCKEFYLIKNGITTKHWLNRHDLNIGDDDISELPYNLNHKIDKSTQLHLHMSKQGKKITNKIVRALNSYSSWLEVLNYSWDYFLNETIRMHKISRLRVHANLQELIFKLDMSNEEIQNLGNIFVFSYLCTFINKEVNKPTNFESVELEIHKRFFPVGVAYILDSLDESPELVKLCISDFLQSDDKKVNQWLDKYIKNQFPKSYSKFRHTFDNYSYKKMPSKKAQQELSAFDDGVSMAGHILTKLDWTKAFNNLEPMFHKRQKFNQIYLDSFKKKHHKNHSRNHWCKSKNKSSKQKHKSNTLNQNKDKVHKKHKNLFHQNKFKKLGHHILKNYKKIQRNHEKTVHL